MYSSARKKSRGPRLRLRGMSVSNTRGKKEHQGKLRESKVLPQTAVVNTGSLNAVLALGGQINQERRLLLVELLPHGGHSNP